jgi:O-antigen/teichoic acid export membrane protein
MSEQKTTDARDRLIKHSLILTLASYFAKAADIVTGLLVAKLLGPAHYGLRNAFGLALQYEANTDLGTFPAANRLVPFMRGKGDVDDSAALKDSAFGVNYIFAMVAASVLFVIALVLRARELPPEYVSFCAFLGVLILTGKMLDYLTIELKIDQRFAVLGRKNVIHASSTLLFCPALAYLLALDGVLLGLALADLVAIAYLLVQARMRPSFKHMSLSAYLRLVQIGFPMMAFFTLNLLMNSSDRLLVIAMLSRDDLGYYAFAGMAATVVMTIPASIHNVTIAPIMELYGATDSRERIKHFFIGPLLLMAYLLPFIVAPIYFGIEVPMVWFFEEYLESVPAIKILIFSAYLQAIASPCISILLALDRQVALIYLMLPLVGLGFGVNYLVLAAGFGIEGLAIAMACLFLVYLLVMLFFASMQFEVSLLTYLRYVAIILAPVALSVALVLLLEFYFEGTGEPLLDSILALLIFVLAYGWIIIPMRKQPAFALLFRKLLPSAHRSEPRS